MFIPCYIFHYKIKLLFWIYLQCRRPGFDLWVGKLLWRRNWKPTPVFLPGELHGHRSLVGHRPWSRKASDMTEWLTHTHTHKTLLPLLQPHWGALLERGSDQTPRHKDDSAPLERGQNICHKIWLSSAWLHILSATAGAFWVLHSKGSAHCRLWEAALEY